MERALRNVNDVAANSSNRESGYPDLTNAQLAQEVQKLSGYNHFSSSTANLLEEVVRRLVCSQGTAVQYTGNGAPFASQDPLDQPVAYGSTVTMRALAEASYMVTLDPREHLKKSQIPKLVIQLTEQGASVDDAECLLGALKSRYNLKAISQQAPANFDVVFYWLNNGMLYWTWGASKDTTRVEVI